jgi:hypothetical protein
MMILIGGDSSTSTIMMMIIIIVIIIVIIRDLLSIRFCPIANIIGHILLIVSEGS